MRVMRQTAKRNMLQACKVVGEEQSAGEERGACEEWCTGEEWGAGKEWGEGGAAGDECRETLYRYIG